MRRLLALLVLVPFAAVVVLSCDDHPTAPEEVQAATTVLESSAPQAAAKAPTLPTPVMLSGWIRTYADEGNPIAPGDPGFSLARCPSGTVAITGGFDTVGSSDFVLMRSNPEWVDGQSGWFMGVWNKSATENLYFRTVAACVAGTMAE
jgi:hypothetical protein